MKRAKRRAMRYKSGAFAAIHEAAVGLYATGAIGKKRMNEFDEACLTPVRDLSPREIRAIRQREGASQEVFAHYLNVTKSSVSKWERGEKHPAGPALKLLILVEKKGLDAIA